MPPQQCERLLDFIDQTLHFSAHGYKTPRPFDGAAAPAPGRYFDGDT
jgi:hypothetical protein